MNDKKPGPTISIPVDLRNPGEFFACCGLFELAHRLASNDGSALGWFENDDGAGSHFKISARCKKGPLSLGEILSHLKQCSLSSANTESREGPVFLEEPFNLILDFRPPFPQNRLVKTFAGQQNLYEIALGLHNAIKKIPDEEASKVRLLAIRASTDKATTSFSIEKAEDAIDAGFSMDTQKKRLTRNPPVFLELLALIGTQRFCPRQGQADLSRIYNAWLIPLPIQLAAVAVATPLKSVPCKRFVFKMYKRDSQGRYKSFAQASNH